MMSGSSLVFCMDQHPNMGIHITMSPLLLPKNKKRERKKSAHLSTFQCKLCKQKPKILLANNCQDLCKLSVQNICTFSTWNLYQTLSLGVQFNFHNKEKKLCLELWKYIFSISNCQSFVVFWKTNYEINWQENAFYWQQNLTGLCDCSYCNFLLTNMTIWLFTEFICIYSFQSLTL